MTTKAINLESSVAWVKSKVRDLLGDTVAVEALCERLDAILPIASISAKETFAAGRRAMWGIYGCAAQGGDVSHIVGAFRADLDAWFNLTYPAELEARGRWTDRNISEHIEARWESRGGKYWVELRHGPYDYFYRKSNGSVGSVCNPNFPVESAILVMQSMLARGMLLPDAAKMPICRIL